MAENYRFINYTGTTVYGLGIPVTRKKEQNQLAEIYSL
jgi:hypothetical protein